MEQEIMDPDLPYDLDERAITWGPMMLSSQALTKYMDDEPDTY